MRIQDPPSVPRKSSYLPPVAVIAREGFKAPNKLNDVVAASHNHLEEILSLKKAVNEQEPYISQRDQLGMTIRHWEAHGGSWKLQVLNALLVEAMESLGEWRHLQPSETKPSDVPAEEALRMQGAFLREWQSFLDHLLELDVFDAPSMKRLLDGRTLAQALGVKPGKWTGKALDICMEWQLRNPDETDPSGAIDEVRGRREELGI